MLGFNIFNIDGGFNDIWVVIDINNIFFYVCYEWDVDKFEKFIIYFVVF